ncbi:hypothetical protein SAMN02745824_1987 [Parasphingorhabdus marina DSM 22363]|uniref:Uncharacterized protein n=1 Tax=Parasphingorhabdus marina DSM 22363 TaxID=1123272 RepID=A0A1N6ELG8_9SPHN|nr:hypothetical protein [Parasphingorhabdus marina]SIN83892.1 hypothetical protein SAMN02745824_1987 [Parasphingorhabdus marina DSM 22363]
MKDMRRLSLTCAALAVPLSPIPAATAKGEMVLPDYSHVTSAAAARALAAEGKLVKILLFPAEFGGEDRPGNVVYVPPDAARAKDLSTGTLIRYFEEGLIDNLTVDAEYKGDSFIPSRILMKATHSSKDGTFNPTISIW